MRTIVYGLTALILLFVAASAQAQQDYYIDVTNNTGYTIFYLNVRSGDAQSWEEDVLGDQAIMTGDTVRVDLSGYNSPIFDLRAIDEDGDSYTFFDINVAEPDLVITLADLDVD